MNDDKPAREVVTLEEIEKAGMLATPGEEEVPSEQTAPIPPSAAPLDEPPSLARFTLQVSVAAANKKAYKFSLLLDGQETGLNVTAIQMVPPTQSDIAARLRSLIGLYFRQRGYSAPDFETFAKERLAARTAMFAGLSARLGVVLSPDMNFEDWTLAHLSNIVDILDVAVKAVEGLDMTFKNHLIEYHRKDREA